MSIEAYKAVYSPPFYLRVGLRYQDIISRSTLGLKRVSWSELLNPAIAGELNDLNLAQDVTERLTVTLLRLPEYHALVRIQHGLVGSQREANRGAGKTARIASSGLQNGAIAAL